MKYLLKYIIILFILILNYGCSKNYNSLDIKIEEWNNITEVSIRENCAFIPTNPKLVPILNKSRRVLINSLTTSFLNLESINEITIIENYSIIIIETSEVLEVLYEVFYNNKLYSFYIKDEAVKIKEEDWYDPLTIIFSSDALCIKNTEQANLFNNVMIYSNISKIEGYLDYDIIKIYIGD